MKLFYHLIMVVYINAFFLTDNEIDDIKNWWIWGYWTSPLMYAQNAIVVNEFLGNSWNHVISLTSNFRDYLLYVKTQVTLLICLLCNYS